MILEMSSGCKIKNIVVSSKRIKDDKPLKKLSVDLAAKTRQKNKEKFSKDPESKSAYGGVWSELEDTILRDWLEAGKRIQELDLPGRTDFSKYLRANRLKIKVSKDAGFWSEERTSKLKDMYELGYSYREIGKYFGKKEGSISNKLSLLRQRNKLKKRTRESIMLKNFWRFSEQLRPLPVEAKSNLNVRVHAFVGEVAELIATSPLDGNDRFIDELGDCFATAAYYFHRVDVDNLCTKEVINPVEFLAMERKVLRSRDSGKITDDYYFDLMYAMIPKVVNGLFLYRDNHIEEALLKSLEKQKKLWINQI